jgi:FkbM family methyltransferase
LARPIRQTRVVRTEPGLSKRASLERMREAGLRPATVFDVGVADGTPELYDVFEGVRYVLIEPLEESEPRMRRIVERHPGSIAINAAAGPKPGEATFVVTRNLSGSSFLLKPSIGESRTVPVVTIDQVAEEHALPEPYLLKLDVQGYELEVLAGAEQALGKTAAVIAEVSLWADRKGKGMAEFAALIAWMRARDFVLFDIAQIARRDYDDAITEMDVVFLPASSPLRENSTYKPPGAAEIAASIRRRKFGLT